MSGKKDDTVKFTKHETKEVVMPEHKKPAPPPQVNDESQRKLFAVFNSGSSKSGEKQKSLKLKDFNV